MLYAPGSAPPTNPCGVRGDVEARERTRHPTCRWREIVEAGARRVSIGGWLAMVAVEAMATAAQEIRDTGDFSMLTAQPPLKDWLGGAPAP